MLLAPESVLELFFVKIYRNQNFAERPFLDILMT